MGRIFKTDFFMRKTKKMDISDEQLLKAVEEMAAGLVDADLGEDVYKKRLPLPGRGKAAARGRSLRRGLAVTGSFSTLTQKTSAKTFLIKN